MKTISSFGLAHDLYCASFLILFAFLSLSIHLISFLYIASFYWMVTSLCVADVDRHFVVVHFDTFIF